MNVLLLMRTLQKHISHSIIPQLSKAATMPTLIWTFIKNYMFKKKSKQQQANVASNQNNTAPISINNKEQQGLFAYGMDIDQEISIHSCLSNGNISTDSFNPDTNSNNSLKNSDGANSKSSTELKRQRRRKILEIIGTTVVLVFAIVVVVFTLAMIICAILI